MYAGIRIIVNDTDLYRSCPVLKVAPIRSVVCSSPQTAVCWCWQQSRRQQLYDVCASTGIYTPQKRQQLQQHSTGGDSYRQGRAMPYHFRSSPTSIGPYQWPHRSQKVRRKSPGKFSVCLICFLCMRERTAEQRLIYDIMRRCVTCVKLCVFL